MAIKLQTILHDSFEVGMALKALNAIFEFIGGSLLLFISSAKIASLLTWLAHDELREDPKDLVANYLTNVAHTVSISGQLFAAIYLLSHGIIKLGLVIALVKRKMWAYPLALGVFALFIAYQLYRYSLHGSWTMLALSALDVLVIILTWLEYQSLKERHMPELYT